MKFLSCDLVKVDQNIHIRVEVLRVPFPRSLFFTVLFDSDDDLNFPVAGEYYLTDAITSLLIEVFRKYELCSLWSDDSILTC